MMTPSNRRVTGGVDTHGDVHVAAVLDSATGRDLGVESFPTSTEGFGALLGWLGGFGEPIRSGWSPPAATGLG